MLATKTPLARATTPNQPKRNKCLDSPGVETSDNTSNFSGSSDGKLSRRSNKRARIPNTFKQSKADYSNFFVKNINIENLMPSPVKSLQEEKVSKLGSKILDEQQVTELISRKQNIDFAVLGRRRDGNAKQQNNKVEHKRAPTPYKTESELQQEISKNLEKSKNEGIFSTQKIKTENRILTRQLNDRELQIARVEKERDTLRNQVKQLERQRAVFEKDKERLNEQIQQLKLANQKLVEENYHLVTLTRQYQGVSADSKGNKLSDMKKVIRDTRKMEFQNDAVNLNRLNQELRNHISALQQQLKVVQKENAKHIKSIEGYQAKIIHAVAAKEQSMRSEIKDLKASLERQTGESGQHFLQYKQEEKKLKQVIWRQNREIDLMHTRIHCLEKKFEQEKENLIQQKEKEYAFVKERYRKFLIEYQQFRKEHTQLKLECMQLKKNRRDQGEEELRLSLSPKSTKGPDNSKECKTERLRRRF